MLDQMWMTMPNSESESNDDSEIRHEQFEQFYRSQNNV